MKVDVALTQALVEQPVPADTDVVVLDIIRATTALVTALAAGAAGVTTVGELERARDLAAERGALLVGERGGLPPAGFDWGNSPGDFTAERCAGRELVLTTTNGTAAVERCRGARRILAGCLRNAEATARALADGGAERVLVVCAGSRGRVAADDVAAAGCLAGSLALMAGAEPSDGARIAAALFDAWKTDLPGLLRRSRSGRNLARVGLADDLALCAAIDDLPLVAVMDPGGTFRRVDPA